MFQPPYGDIPGGYFMRGQWCSSFFRNQHPLVLEIGCGKGEYTLGLAQRYPLKNFIGIDIKGARMWRGCKSSNEQEMSNVAFLRIHVQRIETFFAGSEVSEIWITFPDPQPKQRQEKKRLTHPRFLDWYRQVLSPDGIIHLKTDNVGLYEYTLATLTALKHPVLFSTNDLYQADQENELTGIQTHYEKMFLAEGKKICYLKFSLS